ncbi:hypothetical protein LOTGIDRAFT_232403 [Lottia gigantea]|uniref:HIG1 domain-containing protein n=1 Tax=Lottia gigantea TaxID=225164 RepID=V4AG34_LOTGI|nr:hypothetical protein LOTGIDRAFT_232403 [Lottia gigantea]ESO94130.1 hypothetical protein LOTGIDRAFT_232403 [Lottia gigantea]
MPSELAEERKRIVMGPANPSRNKWDLGGFQAGGFLAKGMVIGTISLVACVAHGVYNYNKRGNVGASPYILNYRVFAQGALLLTVAGSIGLELVASEWRRRKAAQEDKK